MKTFQSTSKCRHILMAGMLAWGVLPGLAVSETNDAAVSLAVTQQNVTLKGTAASFVSGTAKPGRTPHASIPAIRICLHFEVD